MFNSIKVWLDGGVNVPRLHTLTQAYWFVLYVALFLCIFSPQQNAKTLLEPGLPRPGLTKSDFKMHVGCICTHNVAQTIARCHQSKQQPCKR